MLTSEDIASPILAEPSDSLLDRNLGVIRRTDPDITLRIAAAATESLELETAEDGHPTGSWRGRRLASARRPGDECRRMLQDVDPESAGVVAFAGFGLGRHVEVMARRFGTAGMVVVVEPDFALLKAVFSRIDFTESFQQGNIRIIESADPSEVSRRLADADALLTLGIRIVEHPPSRSRLDGVGVALAVAMQEIASNARTNVITTLTRCVTSIENQLENLPRYSLGAGIADLRGVASGRPAIVVSAGPSLRRNIDQLAAPGVRDRVVIIATQTTLKPLLAAGIAPHYVTALDYHEISRRFHEGIDPEAVEDTELIIDSKVNGAVPEAWPGRVRCIPSEQLDRILGPIARGGGPFPSGATVAHLCHFVGRYLGCDPVVLVGQDLGFTDGLYYAPGNAIHDVWTPEFNDFNTIETMEWERIARHRGHLSVREDIHGRRIFTDSQMLSYLRLFESIFVDEQSRGLKTIDASEGGVRKAGTEIASLADVLATCEDAVRGPIVLPKAVDPGLDRAAVIDRLRSVSGEVAAIEKASGAAADVLRRMLHDQGDRGGMDQHFVRLERIRAEVEELSEARGLTDLVNQVGVYKRQRADRVIKLSADLDPVERQRREIERDLVNVEWTADASALLGEMIGRTVDQFETGFRSISTRTLADIERSAGVAGRFSRPARVVAVVPIDPLTGGTGTPRTIAADSGILERTVRRLATSEQLDAIVLLAPSGWGTPDWLAGFRSPVPISLRFVEDGVFPSHQPTIRAARASSGSSWRGGIQGLTVYDEVLAPAATLDAMGDLEADAAVLVGPDWPKVAVRGEYGVDEVIRRYRDRRELPFVFVQAPPGIGSILVTPGVLEIFALHGTRRAGFGHLLGYRSDHPESDPVASRRCVVPPATVRDATGRWIEDVERPNDVGIRRSTDESVDETGAVALIEAAGGPSAVSTTGLPRRFRIELGTNRPRPGRRIPFGASIERPEMTERILDLMLEEIRGSRDVVVVFDGLGDPLMHPCFDRLAARAIEAGVRQVRVRTDLLVPTETIDRLLDSPIDVVEVDLDAEHAGTWETLSGRTGFESVLANLDRLIMGRRTMGSVAGMPAELAPGLPWIVPRIERRIETIDEIPEFFERWRQRVGSAVIDGPTRWPDSFGIAPDPLSPTAPPPHRDRIVAFGRMSILSDGSVPESETDLEGSRCVGRVGDRTLIDLWQDVVAARMRHEQETGRPPVPWRA